MEKTLCNINLDMVGRWLSKNQSFMCLMRTTYGNPHYINDVMENYYRFVGEGNRERIQNRSNFYPVPHRIVAPTGADEPFLLQHRDALRGVRSRGVQRLGRAGAGHHDDRLARSLVSHVGRPRRQDGSDAAQARDDHRRRGRLHDCERG